MKTWKGRWIGVAVAALSAVACSGSSSGGSTGTGGAAGTGTGGGAGMGTGGGGNATAGNACPGVDPIPAGQTACHSDAECPAGKICTYAVFSSGCGACFPPPPRTCATDTDCTPPAVCVEVPNTTPCACSPTPGTECQAPCTATSCGDGERCRSDGHCELVPCTDGYVCADGTVCDATRADADAHGCATARCDTDGYACPDGFRCEAVAGTDLHGCAPIPCEEGFTCPVNTDCDATSTSPHHCAPRACTRDAQCDCGGCVFGTCHDQLLVCSSPPPP